MSLDVGTPPADPVPSLQIIVSVSNGVLSTFQLYEAVPVPSSGFDPLVMSWIFPDDATGCGVYIRAPYAEAGANRAILGNAAFGAGRHPPPIPAI